MALGRRIRQWFRGGDLSGSAPNPIVVQARGLRETAGPTTLTMGAVADGEFLKRDGTTVVGGTAGGGGPATQIDETGGPTTLDIAAIADGQFLKRDGTDIVGDAPTASITPLFIESANEVAQRNGTTGQHAYVYESFTDANNWSRVHIGESATSDMKVQYEALSAGSAANPPGHIQFRWGASRYIGFSGTQLYPDANNTVDLGTGTLRWATVRAVDVWMSGNLIFETGSQVRDAGASFGGVVKFYSTATGDGTWSGGQVTTGGVGTDQNNYDPATIAHFQRWEPSAAVNITGMTRFQQAGQTHFVVNVSANNITFKHQDTNSTAGNRFLCSTGADIVLAQNQGAFFYYDSTTARWRVFKWN